MGRSLDHDKVSMTRERKVVSWLVAASFVLVVIFAVGNYADGHRGVDKAPTTTAKPRTAQERAAYVAVSFCNAGREGKQGLMTYLFKQYVELTGLSEAAASSALMETCGLS